MTVTFLKSLCLYCEVDILSHGSVVRDPVTSCGIRIKLNVSDVSFLTLQSTDKKSIVHPVTIFYESAWRFPPKIIRRVKIP